MQPFIQGFVTLESCLAFLFHRLKWTWRRSSQLRRGLWGRRHSCSHSLRQLPGYPGHLYRNTLPWKIIILSYRKSKHFVTHWWLLGRSSLCNSSQYNVEQTWAHSNESSELYRFQMSVGSSQYGQRCLKNIIFVYLHIFYPHHIHILSKKTISQTLHMAL